MTRRGDHPRRKRGYSTFGEGRKIYLKAKRLLIEFHLLLDDFYLLILPGIGATCYFRRNILSSVCYFPILAVGRAEFHAYFQAQREFYGLLQD
ncbi:hypothetical protein K432DRAFT_108858 [Lepidopterella palustris CBS 459.81]|uniref:Uncharacterized protein n=1 Tax=Lepidopterella palustris CBS 459.81 TaxID=1314670 RepID=A0A8E2JCY1_9PEZI|nr:hypothetical protein K432DRAFT_108858 [Lepidopterella palustris CBS 459.81]